MPRFYSQPDRIDHSLRTATGNDPLSEWPPRGAIAVGRSRSKYLKMRWLFGNRFLTTTPKLSDAAALDLGCASPNVVIQAANFVAASWTKP